MSNEVAHYNKNTGEFSEDLTFGDVHDGRQRQHAAVGGCLQGRVDS